MNRRIRLLLVDDHAVLRDSIGRALRAEPDLELVAEAANGVTALELAIQLRPDVVLMDVSLPGEDGVAVTRRMVEALPQVRVIGLSMYEPADKAKAMRAAGAVAYVPKGSRIDVLLRHIRKANSARRP